MKKVKHINNRIKNLRSENVNVSQVSDGYHSFHELYYHRMKLFKIICSLNSDLAWKSRRHDDGSMFDGMFIVGITTPEGDYTYHYNLKHFHEFNVQELAFAPPYDGHEPKDITRLESLPGVSRYSVGEGKVDN